MILAEVAEPAGPRELDGALLEQPQVLPRQVLHHRVRRHKLLGVLIPQLLDTTPKIPSVAHFLFKYLLLWLSCGPFFIFKLIPVVLQFL